MALASHGVQWAMRRCVRCAVQPGLSLDLAQRLPGWAGRQWPHFKEPPAEAACA
ncbi:hypothetical protein VITFI_CDS0155 [Vitreoscilla filiformis]|uniref:Uncharacterized protein n=1 Tax=Vitreoscilla filiformis TaxID=63 RepID=A0A221KA85_VITFI|nr:hypothetical protein VITFI_CDS0155 [Vitreoscilla filiformis]